MNKRALVTDRERSLVEGPGGIMEMKQTIADLERYRDLVHYIANDYYELSFEKADFQRNEWRTMCRDLIEEMNRD